MSKGISVTAYSPLGSDQAPLIQNEVVRRIAAKYNVGPANVLVSFAANRPGITGTPTYNFWELFLFRFS